MKSCYKCGAYYSDNYLNCPKCEEKQLESKGCRFRNLTAAVLQGIIAALAVIVIFYINQTNINLVSTMTTGYSYAERCFLPLLRNIHWWVVFWFLFKLATLAFRARPSVVHISLDMLLCVIMSFRYFGSYNTSLPSLKSYIESCVGASSSAHIAKVDRILSTFDSAYLRTCIMVIVMVILTSITVELLVEKNRFNARLKSDW